METATPTDPRAAALAVARGESATPAETVLAHRWERMTVAERQGLLQAARVNNMDAVALAFKHLPAEDRTKLVQQVRRFGRMARFMGPDA